MDRATPLQIHCIHLVAKSLSWLTLWERTQRNQDQPRHRNASNFVPEHDAKIQPRRLNLRLGPGLHGRGKCAVGHALVGTAGALPALHQDVSAPGGGWEVDSSSAQVTTARFLLVKIRVLPLFGNLPARVS